MFSLKPVEDHWWLWSFLGGAVVTIIVLVGQWIQEKRDGVAVTLLIVLIVCAAVLIADYMLSFVRWAGIATSARRIYGKVQITIAPPQRRARARLVADVFTHEYERNLTRSNRTLFLGFITAAVYAIIVHNKPMLSLAIIIGIVFILATIRQAVLVWRVGRDYFGDNEHEVRELLLFAMRHPSPMDFFDDTGNLLPAFDIRPDEEPAAEIVSKPLEGAT